MRATAELSEKKNSKMYLTSIVASKFARFEFSGLHDVGILQEKVHKTRITDLDLSTTPLTNGCRHDDMIQQGQLRTQSLFQFVQINDEYFEHLLLQYSSHCVINWIQICRIWRPVKV